LTIFISPKARVKPLDRRKRSAPKERPFRICVR
jgi:hypothetical protein